MPKHLIDADVSVMLTPPIHQSHRRRSSHGEPPRGCDAAHNCAGFWTAASCRRIGLHLAVMAMWEITITCRDGSRLRLSERRDDAPLKGDIFDTADTGQIIKARGSTPITKRTRAARALPFSRSQRPRFKVGYWLALWSCISRRWSA